MAFASPAPSLEPADLLIGIAGALILRLAVYLKGKNAKNTVTAWNTAAPGGERQPISPLSWIRIFSTTSP